MAAPSLSQYAVSKGGPAMRSSATQTEREQPYASAASVLRSLTEGLIIVDRAGLVRQINPAAAQLLAIDAEQAADQPARALPGGDAYGTEAAGPAGTIELGERAIGFRRQPLLSDDGHDQVIGVLIVLHDASAERATRRQQYDYLCRALHDVRVPLQAIGGAAEGLIRGWFGPLNDEQREFAGMIKENANHQGVLFATIYDAYALANGFVQIYREAISIDGVVHEVEHELAGRFAARPLSFTIELAAELPAIMADRQRLRQVLHVLLDNALRYTFPGGAVVLRATPCDGGLRVDVADTGVGIRAAEQARIFTPFFRGDNPLKEGRYGGLSLPVAQQIVLLHGGQIWFESVEGCGSTFSFSLPAALAEGR